MRAIRSIWLKIAVFVVVGAFWQASVLQGAAPADFQWVVAGGGAGEDAGRALAIDAQGNVIVAGYFQGEAKFGAHTLTAVGPWDCFMVKYSPEGSVVWVRQDGGLGDDGAMGVAVGPEGHIYVTGYFEGTASFGPHQITSAGEADAYLARYDADGNILWVRRAGGEKVDLGWALAVDPAGHPFIAGYFRRTADFGSISLTSAGETDAFLARYDTNGDVLWARQIGGAKFDFAFGLAADHGGNVAVSGKFQGVVTFGDETFDARYARDGFVCKYTNKGALVWTRRITGAEFLDPEDISANTVFMDSNGAVFTAGTFYLRLDTPSNLTGLLTETMFFVKYDPEGGLMRLNGGAAALLDSSFGIAADREGRVFVAGGIWHTYLGVFESGGQTTVFRGGGFDKDTGLAVAVDEAGNVYYTGFTGNEGLFGSTTLRGYGQEDMFLAKISKYECRPWISEEPRNTQVALNGLIYLRAGVRNARSFQWKRGNTALPGATNATLRIEPAQLSDSGTYRLTAFNDAGYVESQYVSVSVVQPGSTGQRQYVFKNHSALPIRDGNPVGAASARITVAGVTGTVSNLSVTLHGLAHRSAGDLELRLVGPQGQTVWLMREQSPVLAAKGSEIQFVASGSPVPQGGALTRFSYSTAQHLEPGSVYLSGFNGTNPNGDWRLYVDDVQPLDEGMLVNGWSLSFFVANTPDTAPRILEQPEPRSVVQGERLVLGVSMTGTAPLAFQWLKDGVPIPGATEPALLLQEVQPGDAGVYSVRVVNGVGQTTSTGAYVEVAPSSLQLTSLARTGEDFHFSFPALVGGAYRIETSTNLVDWIPLRSASGFGQPISLSDTPAANTRQLFYRVIRVR
ncbi:MAG: proprotein convertase P-domain-containing protein [Verrucomicrobiota bacterium]